MKKLLFLSLFLLVGCTYDEEHTYCGNYSYSENQISHAPGSENMILLAPAENLFIPFSRMEEIFQEVKACAAPNQEVGVPIIWVFSFSEYGIGGGWGAYHPGAHYVMINTDETIWNNRSCISDDQVVKHEMMHHVLNVTGQDYHEGAPIFEQCGATGVTTCNGEPCR